MDSHVKKRLKMPMRAAGIPLSLLFLSSVRAAQDPDLPSRLPVSRIEMPFLFVYDGRSSRELLGTWARAEKTSPLPDGRRLKTVTYTDRKTGLEVVAESTFFQNQNAVEWLLRMRNGGQRDTPIIEHIRPMDLRIPAAASEPMTLHYVLGSAFRGVGRTSGGAGR